MLKKEVEPVERMSALYILAIGSISAIGLIAYGGHLMEKQQTQRADAVIEQMTRNVQRGQRMNEDMNELLRDRLRQLDHMNCYGIDYRSPEKLTNIGVYSRATGAIVNYSFHGRSWHAPERRQHDAR